MLTKYYMEHTVVFIIIVKDNQQVYNQPQV